MSGGAGAAVVNTAKGTRVMGWLDDATRREKKTKTDREREKGWTRGEKRGEYRRRRGVVRVVAEVRRCRSRSKGGGLVVWFETGRVVCIAEIGKLKGVLWVAVSGEYGGILMMVI